MASCLNDKSFRPTEEALELVLKEKRALWKELTDYFYEVYQKPNAEWKFYGTKAGWVLAVFSNKRRLMNLIPQEGSFQAGFTFSEKAVNIVRDSDISPEVKSLIPSDTQCVCGYGLEMDIKTIADIVEAKKLLEIKAKN